MQICREFRETKLGGRAKELLIFRSCAPIRKGRMQRCAGVGGLATSRRAKFQAKLSSREKPA